MNCGAFVSHGGVYIRSIPLNLPPSLSVVNVTNFTVPDWSFSVLSPSEWKKEQVESPSIVKPVISWADVSLGDAVLQVSDVPQYQRVSLRFPNIVIPEAIQIPSVTAIDYIYPNLREFSVGLVPIDLQLTDISTVPLRLPNQFSFNPDLSFFDKELKLVDLDKDVIFNVLNRFKVGYGLGQVRLDFFSRVGVVESSFLRREREVFFVLFERLRQFFSWDYDLKAMLSDNELFSYLERFYGDKHVVGKERELIKYSILCDIYRAKIKLFSEWFKAFVSKAKVDFEEQVMRFLKDLSASGLDLFIKERAMDLAKKEVKFESELVSGVINVNEVLRDLYIANGRALMLATALEVLNVERDILINEMLITKQEYELADISQDVVSSQREVLVKKWEVLQERLRALNAYKDSLQKDLQVIQASFETKWNELLTRYVRLTGDGSVLNLKSQFLQTEAEIKGLNAYYSLYKEYLQEYLRFNTGYWKTYYDIQKQYADFSYRMRDAYNQYLKVSAKQDNYASLVLMALSTRESWENLATNVMARAQITANIIDSTS